ncbi:MAG: SCO family protein [Candidatus Binatia bacterium]|nr:SCO family protein [Candidatus Binatia bacterium]
MSFKRQSKLWLAGFMITTGLPTFAALAHLPIPPKKGEIGRREVKTPAPSFTLTDQNGKPFHFKPAGGKLVLVNFIYTTCPDVCPLFTAKLAAIQRSLEKEQRDNYLLLSITTDPARDTPVKMKEYAEAFKTDFRRWHFLTGSAKELAQVWKDLGVRVQDLGNGQIQHTNLTALIDGKGLRRVDYYGDKWLEKEVLKDLRRLAGEK